VPTELDLVGGLLESLHFAAEKHRLQRRKDADEPAYINHPIQVAQLITRVGRLSDLATLQAAILHDTIEDTETTFEELREKFGDEVAGLVMEVSDDKSLDKEERKQLQIEHAPNLSPKAKHIKITDKISNILSVTHSPPEEWTMKRRVEYLDWSERVVDGCRGANEALEAHYDEALSECRRAIKDDGDLRHVQSRCGS
jgi:guanosine-3',5'-bis(diphosphate) 3'-pyrophosphohydrolase